MATSDLTLQRCLFTLLLASPSLEKVESGSPFSTTHPKLLALSSPCKPPPAPGSQAPRGISVVYGLCANRGVGSELLGSLEFALCVEDGPIGPVFRNY